MYRSAPATIKMVDTLIKVLTKMKWVKNQYIKN
jgi:hypothetical protein